MTVSREMRDMDQDLEEVRLIAYRQGWNDGFEQCRRLREERAEAPLQQDEPTTASYPSEDPTAKRTRARGRSGRPGLQGERHPGARLREQEVIEIIVSTDPAKVVARRFGVARNTVYGIRARRTWKHVRKDAIVAARREIEQAGGESPMLPTRPDHDDCSPSIDLTAPQP